MAASLLRSACRLQPVLCRSIALKSTSSQLFRGVTEAVPKTNIGQLNLIAKRVISTTPVKNSGLIGHDKLWLYERILAGGLLVILPAAFIWPSAAGDYLITSTLLVHAYVGLKSVVTDYIRPVVFGKVVPPIAQGLLLAVTLLTAAGLFQFIQNDIGIAQAVKRMWAIKGADSGTSAKSI